MSTMGQNEKNPKQRKSVHHFRFVTIIENETKNFTHKLPHLYFFTIKYLTKSISYYDIQGT